MASFSVWHWLIMAALVALWMSPLFGVVRGVRNGAVGHAIASVLLPVYGLIYFFAARRPRSQGRSSTALADQTWR